MTYFGAMKNRILTLKGCELQRRVSQLSTEMNPDGNESPYSNP